MSLVVSVGGAKGAGHGREQQPEHGVAVRVCCLPGCCCCCCRSCLSRSCGFARLAASSHFSRRTRLDCQRSGLQTHMFYPNVQLSYEPDTPGYAIRSGTISLALVYQRLSELDRGGAGGRLEAGRVKKEALEPVLPVLLACLPAFARLAPAPCFVARHPHPSQPHSLLRPEISSSPYPDHLTISDWRTLHPSLPPSLTLFSSAYILLPQKRISGAVLFATRPSEALHFCIPGANTSSAFDVRKWEYTSQPNPLPFETRPLPPRIPIHSEATDPTKATKAATASHTPHYRSVAEDKYCAYRQAPILGVQSPQLLPIRLQETKQRPAQDVWSVGRHLKARDASRPQAEN